MKNKNKILMVTITAVAFLLVAFNIKGNVDTRKELESAKTEVTTTLAEKEKAEKTFVASKTELESKVKVAEETLLKIKKENSSKDDKLKKQEAELSDLKKIWENRQAEIALAEETAYSQNEVSSTEQYTSNETTESHQEEEVAAPAQEAKTENVVASAPSGGNTFTVQATAYDGVSLGGVTATGNMIASTGHKVIAVDPSVIPLGSRVYVEGYGEAVAWDTGGAIQGNIIDLNMSTAEAIQWGRRNVSITIL